MLDGVEAAIPSCGSSACGPGLIFKREAAQEIRRLFVGPAAARRRCCSRGCCRCSRCRPGSSLQAVHADDVGEAYRLAALDADARGAYNVAAEPVLDAARARAAARRPARAGARRARCARPPTLTWRARLQPTPPGWLDMGLARPADGHAPRARGARLDAAARRRRRAAGADRRDARVGGRRRRRRSTPARRRAAAASARALRRRERSRSSFGSSASRSRSIAAIRPGRRRRCPRGRSAAPGASGPGRAARRPRRGRASARPAGRRAAATTRPARRTSSSRSASSPSAVETVGRRAPTSCPRIRCVSASGTTTPSPDTRPQRSARCQNSALQAAVHARQLRDRLRRREAQRALAEPVEQRGGDLGVARDLGREAPVEHREADRREHRPDRLDRQQAGAARPAATAARGRPGRAARRSHGRRRSARARARRRGSAGRRDRR